MRENSQKMSLTLIDDFIASQVTKKGLDTRTEKAYRLDLEHFYEWMERELEFSGKKKDKDRSDIGNTVPEMIEEVVEWKEKIEKYLRYLSQEKGLRTSTISRKYKVVGYFLRYLVQQGQLSEKDIKKVLELEQEKKQERVWIQKQNLEKWEESEWTKNCLSKSEVDAFFQAIRQEYEELDSDFRKRVCLRDQIMMELLFYHGIEISELLKMKVSDYHQKTAVLKIYRKRERARLVYLFSTTLQEQMKEWLNEHSWFEREEEYCNYMFLSKLGKPLSMKMVINIFEKYRVKAAIEKACTPKDLKNSLGRYGEELVRELG